MIVLITILWAIFLAIIFTGIGLIAKFAFTAKPSEDGKEYCVEMSNWHLLLLKISSIVTCIFPILAFMRTNNVLVAQSDCRDRDKNCEPKYVIEGGKQPLELSGCDERNCEQNKGKLIGTRLGSHSFWALYFIGAILMTYVTWNLSPNELGCNSGNIDTTENFTQDEVEELKQKSIDADRNADLLEQEVTNMQKNRSPTAEQQELINIKMDEYDNARQIADNAEKEYQDAFKS